MTTLIEKYIKYLRYEKNYSLHTEISYSTDLQQFADFLQSHFPDAEIKTVDSDIIRMWIVSLMEIKTSPKSVNRKLSTLKSFYKYLLRINETKNNPAKNITGPKMPKPIPAFVKNADMDNILDESHFDSSFESLRDKMMIELFYVTGIRRAELLGLKDIDIEFSNKTILVTGKRNKQRLIPISDKIINSLTLYIETRNKEIENQSGYLFVKKRRRATISDAGPSYNIGKPETHPDFVQDKSPCT